jgi:hypothetical protein
MMPFHSRKRASHSVFSLGGWDLSYGTGIVAIVTRNCGTSRVRFFPSFPCGMTLLSAQGYKSVYPHILSLSMSHLRARFSALLSS